MDASLAWLHIHLLQGPWGQLPHSVLNNVLIVDILLRFLTLVAHLKVKTYFSFFFKSSQPIMNCVTAMCRFFKVKCTKVFILLILFIKVPLSLFIYEVVSLIYWPVSQEVVSGRVAHFSIMCQGSQISLVPYTMCGGAVWNLWNLSCANVVLQLLVVYSHDRGLQQKTPVPSQISQYDGRQSYMSQCHVSCLKVCDEASAVTGRLGRIRITGICWRFTRRHLPLLWLWAKWNCRRAR